MQKCQISISSSGRVFLNLPGKQYKPHRHIGDILGDTLYVNRDPSKHFFRQFKGFGFSYELMRYGRFKWIIVHLPSFQQLVTSRLHVLKNGKILNFKRNDLERQIYLPLDEFGIFAAKETEGLSAALAERIGVQQLGFELR